jgi:hypothetical protein
MTDLSKNGETGFFAFLEFKGIARALALPKTNRYSVHYIVKTLKQSTLKHN